MRLLSGIGAAGVALGAYILATEAIGDGWRGKAGIATQIFFIFGEFTLVAIASAFSSWRAQATACGVLHAALLLLWPALPESGRWLLVQGRKEEAMAVSGAAAAAARAARGHSPGNGVWRAACVVTGIDTVA